METIRERIARLTTLTADELEQLRADIVTEFERLDSDDATVEDTATMQELAGMGEQLTAETAQRTEQAAQAQADRESARERIRALNPSADGEDQSAEGDQPESESEQPAEGEHPSDDAEQPAAPGDAAPAAAEPALAAAGSEGQVQRMARRQTPPQRSPEAAAQPRNRPVLLATGALRGVRDPNTPIDDRHELGRAMAETLDRLPRHGAPRGDVLLASARWSYPEERQLGSDAWENDSKIGAVTDLPSLTASGGICAPTNVDYSVPTWSTADRPLRDALPSFEASRGGVLYVQPPDLGVLSGATGIWTEATDASPGASTKPVVSIQCGNTVQVFVEAISTRIGFGNMQARFAPEQVAANTEQAVAYASRVADNNLLNLLAAVCQQGVTTAQLLGATRDLLTAIYQGLASYRNAHRIPRTQTITAIFPDWLKELIKADLARETAHQQDSSWNSLAITDEQVIDLFRNAGVNPVFHIDGQGTSVSGGQSQLLQVQTGPNAILTFPTKMVWYMYAEGQIQFLDGGRLDLGVVRDSTLDATNDYETFVETFEGLAFRGFTSGAIQYVSSLCANGQSAGTVNTTGSCA